MFGFFIGSFNSKMAKTLSAVLNVVRILIPHARSDTSLLMCNCEKRIIKNRKFEC